MIEKNRRILIVDDHRAIHEDFRKLLAPAQAPDLSRLESKLFDEPPRETETFEIDPAYQGKEGVEMVQKAIAEGRPYGLAFVDMRMPPGWDGLQTVEKIFEVDAEIQVVICTAYSDSSWQEIRGRFGPTDRLLILKKPFDVAEVCQLACAMTQKWQLAHEARQLTRIVQEKNRELQDLYADLQRSSERELARSQNELAESLKLTRAMELARDAAIESGRVKSDFVANMSHELRTPMNGVMGMAEILLGTALTRDQLEYVEIIRSSGTVLLRLINDILDLSKIEAGQLLVQQVEFCLNEPIDGAVRMLVQTAASKGIHLGYSIDPDVPLSMRGDPARLRQVLTNLVGNAVKFTDTGAVSLRVTKERETSDHVVLRFEVQDTGIGIPEPARRRLFQPFFQADSSTTRRHGGTGLGLAISKQLVELMGGSIGFASDPGQGSTFWFNARFTDSGPGLQLSRPS